LLFQKEVPKKTFLIFINYLNYWARKKIIDHFAEKYGHDKIWMMKMSLIYFEDAGKEEDPEILEKGLTWQEVKNYMLKTFSPH
jgi:hypothetical protein